MLPLMLFFLFNCWLKWLAFVIHFRRSFSVSLSFVCCCLFPRQSFFSFLSLRFQTKGFKNNPLIALLQTRSPHSECISRILRRRYELVKIFVSCNILLGKKSLMKIHFHYVTWGSSILTKNYSSRIISSIHIWCMVFCVDVNGYTRCHQATAISSSVLSDRWNDLNLYGIRLAIYVYYENDENTHKSIRSKPKFYYFIQ